MPNPSEPEYVSLREFQELKTEVRVMQADLGSHAQALAVARSDMDRRLEGMNRFREENLEDRNELLRRSEYTAAHEALAGKIDAQFKEVNAKFDGIQRYVWIGLGLALAVSALIGVVIHLIFPVK